jgi:hypothetical protein
MKKIYYTIKIWWYYKKFLNATTTNKCLLYMQKIKKYTDLLEKNKGNKIAAFIRQMKQR